jgi:hypothetical protein
MCPNATLPDSVLTICCAWCWTGLEFLPMLAYKEGRYVCFKCAHTVYPGVLGHQCQCRRCIRVTQTLIAPMQLDYC